MGKTTEKLITNTKVDVLQVSYDFIEIKKPIKKSLDHFNKYIFSITNESKAVSVVIKSPSSSGLVKYLTKQKISIKKGLKIIELKAKFTFNTTGYLTTFLNILAKHKISVFPISTYSTDYIIVKEKDLNKSVKLINQLIGKKQNGR